MYLFKTMNKLILIVLLILVIGLGLFSSSLSGTKSTVAYSGNAQQVKATYDDNGFSPKRITVKAGQPVRMEVDAKVDGTGCMGSITIPGLSEDIQNFRKGKTNIFEVTPPSPGQYQITCAMGLPHGVIVAN